MKVYGAILKSSPGPEPAQRTGFQLGGVSERLAIRSVQPSYSSRFLRAAPTKYASPFEAYEMVLPEVRSRVSMENAS